MINIINGDARNMSDVADDSAHIVITSPPYNVDCPYATYKDSLDFQEYLDMLYDTWEECYRILCPGGRIAVVIPHGTGRNPYIPLYSYVMIQLEMFFNLKGTIVWKKPSCAGKTSWGSWCSPASPSLRDECEMIAIAQKGGEFTAFTGEGNLLNPDLFLELTRDFWEVQPETRLFKSHPAPFPVGIPTRLMRLYAFKGATVVDPFCGSGTTGVAAKQLGINAYLYDIDPVYCELARQRVAQEELFS